MIHQLSLMLSYRIGGDGSGDFGEVSSGTVSESSMLGLKVVPKWVDDYLSTTSSSMTSTVTTIRARGVYLLIFV